MNSVHQRKRTVDGDLVVCERNSDCIKEEHSSCNEGETTTIVIKTISSIRLIAQYWYSIELLAYTNIV